jgi:hypothetical protein
MGKKWIIRGDSMKVGDLVRMKTHETGLIGIVVEYDYHPNAVQVGVRWFGESSSGRVSPKVNYEPSAWLEVVSEGR